MGDLHIIAIGLYFLLTPRVARVCYTAKVVWI